MQRLSLLAVLGAALASGGCRRETGAGVPLDLKGTYVHPGSGIAFPERAAGFERVQTRRYDREGKDVGIGYLRTLADMPLEVTIFVFPPPRRDDGTEMSPEDQFEREVAEVRRGKSDVREAPRVRTTVTYAEQPVVVTTAEFSYVLPSPDGTRSMRVASLLASFLAGAWRITYRATAPPVVRTAAWAALEDLLAQFGLPSTGVKVGRTAGPESREK